MTLSDVLNKLSHKEIKALIRSYNLHTRIKLGQSKEALIEALNTHFNLNITDNKLIAKEYKVDIPTPAPIRATRRRPAPVELTEEEIKNKRIAEIENELNNIYSNLQAKDKETQAINDNLNKAIEEMKTRKAKKTLSKLLMEKVANLRKKKQDREIELLQQAQEQAKKEEIPQQTPKQEEMIDIPTNKLYSIFKQFYGCGRIVGAQMKRNQMHRSDDAEKLERIKKEYNITNITDLKKEIKSRFNIKTDNINNWGKELSSLNSFNEKCLKHYMEFYKYIIALIAKAESESEEIRAKDERKDRLKNLLITSMDMRSKFKKDKAMDMRSKSKEDKEATEKAQQELQALRDAKKTRKQAETKQTIPSKYLSGYIGINKKSNTFKYNIADEKKYKIKDEMFDIIDNKFTSSEVNKLVNNLNINASTVVDTARNFYDDKINAGKGVEYTDFVSLVIYPSLLKNTPKKSLTIEDKFILLLFANDIANEQFFSDVEPINKGSVAMQFLKPQTIGTKIGNYLGKEFQKLIQDLGMGDDPQAPQVKAKAEEIPETQILLKKADDLSKEYYSKLLIGKETEDIKNKYKDIQDKLNNLDVYTENLSTKEQFNKARKQEKNERKDRLKNLLTLSMTIRNKSKIDKEATKKAQQELQALRDAKKARMQAQTQAQTQAPTQTLTAPIYAKARFLRNMELGRARAKAKREADAKQTIPTIQAPQAPQAPSQTLTAPIYAKARFLRNMELGRARAKAKREAEATQSPQAPQAQQKAISKAQAKRNFMDEQSAISYRMLMEDQNR